MREAKDDVRWREVPYNEKREVMKRINAQLDAEGIPEVTLQIVSWRMSKALVNLKQSNPKQSEGL